MKNINWGEVDADTVEQAADQIAAMFPTGLSDMQTRCGLLDVHSILSRTTDLPYSEREQIVNATRERLGR